MDKKRTRITYLLVAASLCLAAWAASAMPRLAKPKTLPTNDVPHVDPKPPVTVQIPQAAPRVLNDSEQRQADAYQREAGRQQQEAAAAAPRIDEVQPGGKYEVDGRVVDAEGREV